MVKSQEAVADFLYRTPALNSSKWGRLWRILTLSRCEYGSTPKSHSKTQFVNAKQGGGVEKMTDSWWWVNVKRAGRCWQHVNVFLDTRIIIGIKFSWTIITLCHSMGTEHTVFRCRKIRCIQRHGCRPTLILTLLSGFSAIINNRRKIRGVKFKLSLWLRSPDLVPPSFWCLFEQSVSQNATQC